jgi:hypothetical protein
MAVNGFSIRRLMRMRSSLGDRAAYKSETLNVWSSHHYEYYQQRNGTGEGGENGWHS